MDVFVIPMLMKTYDELRTICKLNSRVTEKVVDDFLISYAAGHQGLEKKIELDFDRFRHVAKQLGKENVNMLKSQYLVHKVFREGGLLGKFMRHPALDRFKGEERDFLAQALKLPWRFCFSVIVDEPSADFYTMEDVLTGKCYLLYSPAVSGIRDSARPVLWFNLIGFNGFCWQSYGPVVYYQSFEAGDIWFYATELNPDLEDLPEVAAHVELDPLPYMMLISGATMPLSYYKDEQLKYLLSEFDQENLDTASLKEGFRTEYEKGVYRITHKKWGEHPHYAQVFFDEEKQLLLFSAMTRRGFDALVKDFNAFGHDFPAEPFLQVNLSMQGTVAMILQKKVVLNEYLDLFQLDSDPVKEKVVEDINAFIALVLPQINAGKTPDIEAAARETGVDPETALSVVESVLGSLDKMPGPGGEAPGGEVPDQKAGSDEGVGIEELPAQAREGIRLLSSDDKLLFDLYLYMMANKIRRKAPWEYLHEDEIFGVQVPGTDRVYFVSVMGASGDFPALSFYKGYEGLAGYWGFRARICEMLQQDDPPESMMDAPAMAEASEMMDASAMMRASTMIEGMMTIPHMMLSFTDREELGRKDLAAIKKSGARFRGKGNWPQIEEVVPGYFPEYPARESLVDLFLVMQQVLEVLEKYTEDVVPLFRGSDPEESYLVRVPTGKGPKFRWKDYYLFADPEWGLNYYSVKVDIADRDALSRLPEASQELQIDLVLLPAPVKEKGSKAYFPFVLLMVDKHNGMIISSSVLSPKPDLFTMYESVPQKVFDELLKTGHRPSAIEIRSDLLLTLLEETLEDAGCLVEWEDHMPAMDEVIDSLISNLS